MFDVSPTTGPSLTPPPDPNSKTPRLIAPPGAIDCHVHLFGPAARYPFHPGSKYISNDALPQTQLMLQDTLGLSGAVVVSGGGYGRTTRHLEDVLTAYPQRFRGVALLPDTVSRADIARLHRLGVRGARFVSHGHGGALPRMADLTQELAQWMAEVGWHVQFYPARDDLASHAEALLAQPNAIVLDHFACLNAALGVDQVAFSHLLKLLDTGRVWVKLSGPMRCADGNMPYASVAPIARALVRHAPERLLWGSDWPHVNMNHRAMPNDGDLFDLLGDWVAHTAHATAVLEQILVVNPRQVYGFTA
jgi:predicted TIM-barrel fold metal-dependent hydrolase